MDERVPPSVSQQRRRRAWRDGPLLNIEASSENPGTTEIDVGFRLRELRTQRGLSIRTLAEMSGLNFNTLSLIENGKTSPSVSTLQQLAIAMQVPIKSFFETETVPKNIVFQKSGKRPRAAFLHGTLEDLGPGITLQGGQPLRVTLSPKADSGPEPIVHTGHEFVYCLSGRLCYTIDGKDFTLEPGDSLLFEAYLPHRWRNPDDQPALSLLILCPSDENERPSERHFTTE
jgi:transcriptional regulator with XRE-family HTH domain